MNTEKIVEILEQHNQRILLLEEDYEKRKPITFKSAEERDRVLTEAFKLSR